MSDAIRIGHLEVDWPWGPAGGVVRSIGEIETMARVGGIGWIEVGSYTLEKRLGNQYDETGNLRIDPRTEQTPIVYHHDAVSGTTTNSLGMPNEGMDQVEKDIPDMVKLARKFGKELIVNVAPVSEYPLDETEELVRRAYEAGAPAVLVNLGCPNVLSEGGARHEILSYEMTAMAIVLAGLAEVVEKHPKVFVRVSPYATHSQAAEAYMAIRLADTVGAVWTPNTWPVEPGASTPLGVGGGGVSGPSKAPAARRQTAAAVELLAGSGIDVVSSSSIMTAAELKVRQELGAVAGAGTTFFYESQDWQTDNERFVESLVKLYS